LRAELAELWGRTIRSFLRSSFLTRYQLCLERRKLKVINKLTIKIWTQKH